MCSSDLEEELEVLAAVAARMRRRAGVAIRLNPDVDPKTHTYISTGKKESKFGVDIEPVEALARRALALPSPDLPALQCHIGSQLTTVEPYVQALERTVALAERIRKDAPSLAYIDMGGGFGIYYKDTAAPAIEAYARAVGPVLRGKGFRLVLEPGRVIVGNAGVLLTRVEYLKPGPAKSFAIVDAAMNDLMRPALYDAHHGIVPVKPRAGATSCYEIVGPVCESGDFLGHDRDLAIEEGDLLALLAAAAYGRSFASDSNTRPSPAAGLLRAMDLTGVIRRFA